MAEKKEGRVIIKGKEARLALLEGAKFANDSIATTFGPRGRNVMIEKPFGRPLTTRDGVSVARDTYTSERAINMGAQRVLEASETTNRIAGDGTTATSVLSYHLLRRGVLAINAGQHPMEIKQTILEDSYKVLDKLESLKKEVKQSQLKEVATISSGDPLLGELIAEAIIRVGADGGIITEKAPVDDIEREYVDGYYLQSGFQALQAGKKELIDPFVIVSVRRLTSAADIAELLTKALQSQNFNPQTDGIPRFLLIGNIEEAAYFTAVNFINQGKIDAVIVKTPPMYGEMGKLLLEDIAIYAGCQAITDSTNLRNIPATLAPGKDGLTFRSFVGTVDKVTANKSESTLFADNNTEAIQQRIQELKDQIETEIVDAISEKYKDRVAKLQGKIALFRIGGATDSVKEEVEFRVEDAIHATRAAFTDGIVAGGGITLLELSKLDISPTYREALRDTFKQLLLNANLQAELKLDEALKAPVGYGFNLRKNGELVDMIKSGIIDPALVIREVVKNATASAGDMLAIGSLVVFEDRQED